MHRKTLCMIIFSLKDTRQHWYKNTRQQEFQQNPFHTVNLLESQDVEEPGVTVHDVFHLDLREVLAVRFPSFRICHGGRAGPERRSQHRRANDVPTVRIDCLGRR